MLKGGLSGQDGCDGHVVGTSSRGMKGTKKDA